jgi:phage-related protein
MRLDNLSRKLRPLGLSIALGLNMALLSATGAWAQQYDVTRRDLENFHQFLENHPRIAQELRSNPSVINNRRWVDDHNELEAFLRRHPEIREELRANPQRFMAWERRYDRRWGDNVSWREVRMFEDFLDSHPRVAERLRRNPNLVNDREFLTSHDDLNDFLRDHSSLRRSLQSNPYAFVERASR